MMRNRPLARNIEKFSEKLFGTATITNKDAEIYSNVFAFFGTENRLLKQVHDFFSENKLTKGEQQKVLTKILASIAQNQELDDYGARKSSRSCRNKVSRRKKPTGSEAERYPTLTVSIERLSQEKGY